MSLSSKEAGILRTALWTAYGYKCFYCSREIDWNDLNIDHVIPEAHFDTAEKISAVRTLYSLSNNFQFTGIDNLVPCHAVCNRNKSDMLFNESTARYFLARIEAIKPSVTEATTKLTAKRKKGLILSRISAAIASGLLTENDLKKLSQSIKTDDWASSPIRLPEEVEFIDEIYDSFFLHADYDYLLDKTLKIMAFEDSLPVTNKAGDSIEISTLREWRKAHADGYYAYSTVGIKASFAFTYLDDLLNALEMAKMPKTSFLDDPWIGLQNLEYLSPKLLFHPEHEELIQFASEGRAIRDLVEMGVVEVNHSNINTIVLTYSYMETTLSEQFRADFNDDGLEEMFVKCWVRATEGTFGSGYTQILGRTTTKSLIEPTT